MALSDERWEYNDEGQLITSVDSFGKITRYSYDHRGNLVQKTVDDRDEKQRISVQLHRFFISYSRSDLKIVGPLVKLLSIADDRIFIDLGIRPGSRWRAVLTDGIENCEMFVLFWCCHSGSSSEVQKEYTQALTDQKAIVPVLLDNTPVPFELAEYQAVDLRTALGAHEGYVDVEEHIPGASAGGGETRITRKLQVLTPDVLTLRDAYTSLSSALEQLLKALDHAPPVPPIANS